MGMMIAALLWGFSEATLFFIIPDVILTAIAIKGFKKGFYASLIALAGALIGGSIMYLLAVYHFDFVYQLVEKVPAISEEMLEKVNRNLEGHGLIAMIVGPIGGIPYKAFAIMAPSNGIGFMEFLLASVPARFVRFFLTSTLAWFLANICFKQLSLRVKYTVWLIVWIIVYCIYFSIHL